MLDLHKCPLGLIATNPICHVLLLDTTIGQYLKTEGLMELGKEETLLMPLD